MIYNEIEKNNIQLTFFEITTLASFLYYKDN